MRRSRFGLIAWVLLATSCALSEDRFGNSVKKSLSGVLEVFVSQQLGPTDPVEFDSIVSEWKRIVIVHCPERRYEVVNYRELASEIVDGDGEVALSVYGEVSCL